MPKAAPRFSVGAETRRLDADGRFKIAWTTPAPVRLSELLGWSTGALDVVCVDGWMLLSQPDELAGVTPRRNGVHARFSVDTAGVERVGLKSAHVNRLGVSELRTVLVAPVPDSSSLIVVNPSVALGGAPPHVMSALTLETDPSEVTKVPKPQFTIIKGSPK